MQINDKVLSAIANERERQVGIGYTAEHDDEHDANDFRDIIDGYVTGIGESADEDDQWDCFVQIAALAIAACESIDRKATR